MRNFEKLKIPQRFIIKWKDAVYTLSKIIDVDVVLITRSKSSENKILYTYSQSEQKSFKKENKYKLTNNYVKKEIKLKWFNGNIFGAICLYNKNKKNYKESDEKILKQFKELIESHLEIIYKEQTDTFSNMLNKIPGIVYKCENDKNWTMNYMSKGVKEITGYKARELTENEIISYGDLIKNEYKSYVWKKVQQAIDNKESFQIEYKITTKNNKEKWVWEQGKGIYDENDDFLYIQGLISDITKNKKREKKLNKIYNRFHKAIEFAPFPIMLHAEDGEILKINRVWEELSGYNKNELNEIKDWIKKVYNTDKTKKLVEKEIKKLYNLNSRIDEGEFNIKTKSGKSRVWNFSTAPLGEMEDGRKMVISIAKDMTKQKNIKNELKKEKEFLNKILNIQGAIVIVLDPQGRIVRFNNESQKITGYSEKGVLNKLFWDIFLAKKEKNKVKSVFENIVGNKDFPNEFTNHIKTKKGELRLISWKNTAVLENKEVKYVIATGLDITEQKQRMDKLKEKRQELNDTNQQLTAYLEEIAAMNEELESSLSQVNELNKRFSNMVKVISGLIEHQNEKNVFLSEILESAIEIVPEADYGKILALNDEKDKWEFIDAIGHNINILKNIQLKEEVLPELNEEEVIYSNNYSINRNKLAENNKVILKDAFKAIEKTIYTNIKIDKEPVGRIVLDIAQGSNEEFTKVSEKILRSFSNLASAFFSYRRYNILQGEFTKEMITSIVQILELYDKYTKGHSENVAKMSAKIAEEMGYSQKKINDAYWTGMVHDIGKLLVSLDILNKKDRLSDEEYKTIKKHPYWGYKALSSSKTLEDIANYVLYHHERWDGKGYPEGLKKEEIPLLSQILAVADAWDAMTSARSYREPLSRENAIKELRNNKANQFSPNIVEITLKNNILL